MMDTPEKSREARGATGKEEVSLEMQDKEDKEGKEGGEEEEEEVEEEVEKLLRRRARAYCRNQLKANSEKKMPVKRSAPECEPPYCSMSPTVPTIITSNTSSSCCPGSLVCPSMELIMVKFLSTTLPPSPSSISSTLTSAASMFRRRPTMSLFVFHPIRDEISNGSQWVAEAEAAAATT